MNKQTVLVVANDKFLSELHPEGKSVVMVIKTPVDEALHLCEELRKDGFNRVRVNVSFPKRKANTHYSIKSWEECRAYH